MYKRPNISILNVKLLEYIKQTTDALKFWLSGT